MRQRQAVIATCAAHRDRVQLTVFAALLLIVACSTPPTAGGEGLPTSSDVGTVLPGFDGFAFDVQPGDGVQDSAPDVAGELPDDVSESARDDADVDDAADVTAADVPSETCKQPCVMDDDCNQAADPCAATTCQSGCCAFSSTQGALCDDGIPCNGPDTCKNGTCTPAIVTGCDDGLTCTTDTCDGEKCHHTVMDGWCHIGTTCVQGQAAIPGEPCKICDPKLDQDSWSNLPDCCTKDTDCKAAGPCDTPTCEPTLGQCVIVKIPGCCKGNADCDDGDLCTTDACDLGSGNCASTAVTCPSPSLCEIAACDATDGQCKSETLPGWCIIDGQCVGSNTFNPANGCELCLPNNKPTAWSASPGTYCNDNNACTFSDICDASGACNGVAQPGCCQADADCSDNGLACKVGHCNAAVGLCTLADKPGCCTSGICCDTNAQAVLAAGTQCGTSLIGTDYQCSGADIQQRDYTPGCNGTSASVCSKSMDSASASPWTTVSTCPANTLCTPQGSGLLPSCVIQGSCAGACGGVGSQGCSCTAGCVPGVDCCTDFQTVCACTSGECCNTNTGVITQGGTCQPAAAKQFQCSGMTLQSRVASGQCGGAATCLTDPPHLIWGNWQTVETCVNSCQAATDGSSGSCVAPAGTCNGVCGTWWLDQPCHCDSACVAAGNCCADFLKVGCNTVTSCGAGSAGSCINNVIIYSQCVGIPGTNGCSCNSSTCKPAGNCCADMALCQCP